jgi:hypothetical protein
MQASAAVSQRITGDFQISGKCIRFTRAGSGIATDGYASSGIPEKVTGRHRDWLSVHI